MSDEDATGSEPGLPPGTRIVSSPGWDPKAPKLELAEQRERERRASAPSTSPTTGTLVSRRTATAVLTAIVVGTLAIAGFALLQLTKPDDANVVAGESMGEDSEPEPETETETGETGEAAVASREELEAAYRREVVETAVALGIEVPSNAEIGEPNAFAHLVHLGSSVTLRPGKVREIGPLRFRLKVETRSLPHSQGITSKGQHTSLMLTNTGPKALAYRLLYRTGAGGNCKSPVVFDYDAMVIDAGETFEISICAGRQTLEIIDLRTLELGPLGAAWVRQIPPRFVGLPGPASVAHDPGEAVRLCEHEGAEILRAIEEEVVDWEDVIDFYSRHDCHHHRFSDRHHLATRAVDSLPLE
jgi:hypothetical protein